MTAAAAWLGAVGRLGGDLRAARASGADLERRWAQAHRRYHTATHLEAILRDAAWLAGELGLDEAEHAVIALAACAHDVVYDARPGDDERASAEWARQALTGCGLADQVVERVAGLVLATIDHAAGDADPLAAVLLDADLAVLGSEPDDYERYVAGVRAEYAAVPDDEFRRGRASVLEALRARNPLFRTEPGRDRWEARARHNLDAELARLGAAGGMPPTG
jgi:predicted metal-dependent HD superfamily phosphohydrolase